jgi:pyruvate/2-oxoglutarate dehydrogenase complex dihydrolipoamide acyltransferase (E2) component
MAKPTAITVPHENVNDQSVTIIRWLVPDSAQVEQGQAVVTLEGSKTTFEVCAPAAGTLHHHLPEGADVEVGGVLALIGEEVTSEAPTNGSTPILGSTGVPPVKEEHRRDACATGSSNGHAPPGAVRFSQEALQVIRQQGLDPAQFAGRGLVRARDVLGKPPAKETKPQADEPGPIPAGGVPVRSEKISRAKRTEIQYLRSGARHTLPSVITVGVPTRGLRAAAARHPEVQGNVTALAVYEAARLLRQFPCFNGFYHGGAAHYYEEVHVGVAIDAGLGLKVPVLRNADRKTVPDLVGQMRELVVAYLNDELPVEALAGGTFTVTDLSGEGVFDFVPLLNQGQSAILGIGGEVFLPGSGSGMFNLILAFDHQLAEGRQAGRFLGELRRRLEHYEAAMAQGGATKPKQPCCSECLRPYDELKELHARLVQTVGADGAVALVCSVCLAGF